MPAAVLLLPAAAEEPPAPAAAPALPPASPARLALGARNSLGFAAQANKAAGGTPVVQQGGKENAAAFTPQRSVHRLPSAL